MINALPLNETSNLRVTWRSEDVTGQPSQTSFYVHSVATTSFTKILNVPNTQTPIEFAYFNQNQGVYQSNQNLTLSFFNYSNTQIDQRYGSFWRSIQLSWDYTNSVYYTLNNGMVQQQVPTWNSSGPNNTTPATFTFTGLKYLSNVYGSFWATASPTMVYVYKNTTLIGTINTSVSSLYTSIVSEQMILFVQDSQTQRVDAYLFFESSPGNW